MGFVKGDDYIDYKISTCCLDGILFSFDATAPLLPAYTCTAGTETSMPPICIVSTVPFSPQDFINTP